MMAPICDEQNIILYIENELPESEMLRTEQHIAHCRTCRALLDEHRLIRNTLNHASRLEVPDNFAAAVTATLPAPYQNLLTTAREQIIAAAAGIVLTVIGLVSYIAGTQAHRMADLLNPSWWNTLVIKAFSVFSYSFRFILHLVKILASVGIFIVQGLAFILKNLGHLVVFSTPGQVLLLITAGVFIATGAMLWRMHFGVIKEVRAYRR